MYLFEWARKELEKAEHLKNPDAQDRKEQLDTFWEFMKNDPKRTVTGQWWNTYHVGDATVTVVPDVTAPALNRAWGYIVKIKSPDRTEAMHMRLSASGHKRTPTRVLTVDRDKIMELGLSEQMVELMEQGQLVNRASKSYTWLPFDTALAFIYALLAKATKRD